MAKKIDMIGFKSGLLTVIAEGEPDNGARWICQCECGNTILARGSALRGPKPPQSCGCERVRKLVENNKTKHIKDITGQRIGYLTVIEMTDMRSATRSIVWKCRCDCGKEIFVPSGDLCHGNTKSCGCQQYKSYGERKIRDILTAHNISFTQEYKCKDLVFSDTGYHARFDFYVDNKYIIEYDGVQHFVQGNGAYDNTEKFQRTQQHDAIKNQYCKDNNIPLIRIPYTELNNITLEMLTPETSKYLI